MNATTPVRELWLNEHQTLRQEVLSLKECQISVLKWAYSILGAVLAFSWGLVLASGNQQTEAMLNTKQALTAAIVLLIGTIIGSFLVQIIVHKTRSVFRLCGYIRVLEKLLAETEPNEGNYPGYENAYHTLRIIQQEERRGFDIDFRQAFRQFANDIVDKLPSFLKKRIRHNDNFGNGLPPSSGKYYRRIAFQVHFLGLLSLASAIFLLFVAANISTWKIVISVISGGFWLLSYIHCTAQTRMQEMGGHSIDGQFKLWCEAMTRCGYNVVP